MSTPISATITSAVRRATPVQAAREFDAGRERAKLRLDRLRESADLHIKEVEMREDRADHQRVMRFKAPLQRLFERGKLPPLALSEMI